MDFSLQRIQVGYSLCFKNSKRTDKTVCCIKPGRSFVKNETSQLIKRFLSESEWYKESIIVYEWCPPYCELITSRSSTPCACEGTVCLLQTATVIQGTINPFHNSDMAIQKIRLSLKWCLRSHSKISPLLSRTSRWW